MSQDAYLMTVIHRDTIEHACQNVDAIARQVGFTDSEIKEITDVATNLIAHLIYRAKNGVMICSPIVDKIRRGIRIEVDDNVQATESINPIVSDRRSLSAQSELNIEAINQLMDFFEIGPTQVGKMGLRIVCKRWLPSTTTSGSPCQLDFGVVTRAHPEHPVDNGDSFIIRRDRSQALVGVIDGVGHGKLAHHAAKIAHECVEKYTDETLITLFSHVANACRPTRGVVMALAQIDWLENRLSITGIGNVEVRLLTPQQNNRLNINRGILGFNTVLPKMLQHAWDNNSILVLHSDGISPDWEPSDFPDFYTSRAQVIAQRLFARLADNDDDATIIVIKGHA